MKQLLGNAPAWERRPCAVHWCPLARVLGVALVRTLLFRWCSMLENAIRRFGMHVLFPTLLGASIYLLFRSPSLLVFWWIDGIGLLDHLKVVRDHLSVVQLPDWFLYSLPDGLWVYATTSWMLLIWRGTKPVFWLSAGLLLAVATEFGQAVNWVPGTYQSMDVLFYVGGFLLALLQVRSTDETSPVVTCGPVGHGRTCIR